MNITQYIAKSIVKPCRVRAPVYDHINHGWVATNSINAADCVPTYRNVGGGTLDSDLEDLPTALKQSISNLNHRINEATRLKLKLEKLLEGEL